MLVTFPKTCRSFVIIFYLLACGCGDVRTPPELDNNQFGNVSSDRLVTGDVPSRIPENELNSVQEGARHGDNSAAQRLSEHYRALGQTREQLEWLVMAASRGDCASMALLKEFWQNQGNSSLASRWNNQLRANRCTWAKAYGPLQGGDTRQNDMPLWTD